MSGGGEGGGWRGRGRGMLWGSIAVAGGAEE